MSADNTPAVRAARRDPVPATYSEAMQVGATLAASGFFDDAKSEAKAAAKVIAGMELGLGPMASMTGIHLVQGKVTLGANLIAALIQRSGVYDFRVTRMEPEAVEIAFFEGGQEIGRSPFTRKDAEAAGLWGKSGPWKQHPRNMLYARAMSNGAKWFTPAVFAGPVYTPDELGAQVDGETGEVVELPPEPGPSNDEALARERAAALLEAGPREVVVAAMREAGIRSADLHDDDTFHRARTAVVAAMEATEAPEVINAQQMKLLHAKGRELGLNHDALHQIAADTFPGVESMTAIPADGMDLMLEAMETEAAQEKAA